MHGLVLKEAGLDEITAQKVRAQVIRNALQAGLAGMGLGMGARGLQGILNQWHRTLKPAPVARKPSVVDIPVPGEEQEEEQVLGVHKMAEQAGLIDWFMHPVQTAGSWMSGNLAESAGEIPFGWLPTVAMGAGGAAAGWKGLDYALDRAREQELAAQESQARKEYEEALAAQSKVGQALHAELDTLYEKLSEQQRGEIEKTAGVGSTAMNVYGLYALVSGLIPGVWAYEATKARQQGALLEKARKKYRRSRETMRPTPIYARPAPMQQGSSMKSAPDEDELEGAPLDKAARQGLVLSFAR